MRRIVRGVRRAVQQADIAVHEHPLPRHFHIVEEHDAVHLLEARAERMVEMRPSEIEAVAAQEAQPRCSARDGEGDRERAVVLGVLSKPRRIHRDLVGERAKRRQHARAAHHDAGTGFAHHAQRRAFLQVEHARWIAAALQVDQRVGQDDVVLADVFVVAPDVVAELRPAAREIIGRGGPGRQRHVHEVRRASHHAAGRARPVQHHYAARFQFLPGARHDERKPDAVAGGGRDIGHRVAVLRIALHVVKRGDRARAAGKPGMGGHVVDALSPQPDLALLLLEAR